jgi:hypothetical protein
MSLAIILLLYTSIGVLAAVGTIHITRHRFSPGAEQRFLALVLVPIALLYLAFTDHFESPAALSTELPAIGVFVALALLGVRWPVAAILGYALHGGWDLVHEIVRYRATSWSGQLTPIPLAYGAFCGAYDLFMAGYMQLRRPAWRAATMSPDAS